MSAIERRIDARWMRDAGLGALVLSLLLGLIGPYGDYSTIRIGPRILTWLAYGVVSCAIHASLLYLLERFRPSWPWMVRQGATALLGSAVLLPLMLLIDAGLAVDTSVDWLATYPMIFGITVAHLGVYEALRLFRRVNLTPAPVRVDDQDASSSGQTPGLLRRMPEHLGSDLICLMKEDHYLRIHTDRGDCLIRLRMSDAMLELEGVQGLQTHRSWWVADAAVVRAERRPGGGADAILTNGLTAPIARSRLAEAQAAGWFERRKNASPERTGS